MLQQTDIRIAEERAVFGLPEAKLGLIAGAGSTVRLKRQIPYTKAMEMILTGEPLTAAEAYHFGLVGHVVPTGQSLDKARQIAARVAANGPLASATPRPLSSTAGGSMRGCAQDRAAFSRRGDALRGRQGRPRCLRRQTSNRASPVSNVRADSAAGVIGRTPTVYRQTQSALEPGTVTPAVRDRRMRLSDRCAVL